MTKASVSSNKPDGYVIDLTKPYGFRPANDGELIVDLASDFGFRQSGSKAAFNNIKSGDYNSSGMKKTGPSDGPTTRAALDIGEEVAFGLAGINFANPERERRAEEGLPPIRYYEEDGGTANTTGEFITDIEDYIDIIMSKLESDWEDSEDIVNWGFDILGEVID